MNKEVKTTTIEKTTIKTPWTKKLSYLDQNKTNTVTFKSNIYF